ncbi:serine protease [Haloferula helveola]
MRRLLKFLPAVGCGVVMMSCAPQPPPPIVGATPPGKSIYQSAARRFAAVVVSDRMDIDDWIGDRFSRQKAPKDADGGSAVPITADGYFLTADHVLASSTGRQVFVLLRRDGRLRAYPARIVWRGSGGDVAVLQADVATPDHYRWTPTSQWLPQGTPVMHAGIATGFSSPAGKLITPIPPDAGFSGNHRFKHDIPLEPGDSGGPVVDANGLLVGINSAVEYLVPLETAFFIESEANRPNVRRLMSVIERDRKRRPAPAVSMP